jgi:pyridoxal phosphate enzyme (YggS family)
MVNKKAWQKLSDRFVKEKITLIAVSKTKPAGDIKELYDLGQRDFGENYVQELVEKSGHLPTDINWHYIGHLQGNKVKMIAPFVHMIHAVDSFKLLVEINKHAQKNDRIIDVLLQMHIADEETKFGLDEKELMVLLSYYDAQKADLKNICIRGLMGMATNTEDKEQVQAEFHRLRNFFTHLSDTSFFGKANFDTCSMGMSADYNIAIKEGSTMVRIGSLLFGSR